jgi:hypothetical protein
MFSQGNFKTNFEYYFIGIDFKQDFFLLQRGQKPDFKQDFGSTVNMSWEFKVVLIVTINLSKQ